MSEERFDSKKHVPSITTYGAPAVPAEGAPLRDPQDLYHEARADELKALRERDTAEALLRDLAKRAEVPRPIAGADAKAGTEGEA